MRDEKGSIDWKLIAVIAGVAYFLMSNTASQVGLGSQLRDNNMEIGGVDKKLDAASLVLGTILDGLDKLTIGMNTALSGIATLGANDKVIMNRLDSQDARWERQEAVNTSILSFLQNLASGSRQSAPVTQQAQPLQPFSGATVCDATQVACPVVVR